MVIRMPYGGINALEHHSESMEAIFGRIPGLKVVVPSTHTMPRDAYSSYRERDTILFMEPKRIYRAIKQEVEEEFTIPLAGPMFLHRKYVTVVVRSNGKGGAKGSAYGKRVWYKCRTY